MAPITTSVEVGRSPDDAFAYVTDPARFVEWQHPVGTKERRVTTSPLHLQFIPHRGA
jgi:hypothetical protein